MSVHLMFEHIQIKYQHEIYVHIPILAIHICLKQQQSKFINFHTDLCIQGMNFNVGYTLFILYFEGHHTLF